MGARTRVPTPRDSTNLKWQVWQTSLTFQPIVYPLRNMSAPCVERGSKKLLLDSDLVEHAPQNAFHGFRSTGKLPRPAARLQLLKLWHHLPSWQVGPEMEAQSSWQLPHFVDLMDTLQDSSENQVRVPTLAVPDPSCLHARSHARTHARTHLPKHAQKADPEGCTDWRDLPVRRVCSRPCLVVAWGVSSRLLQSCAKRRRLESCLSGRLQKVSVCTLPLKEKVVRILVSAWTGRVFRLRSASGCRLHWTW